VTCKSSSKPYIGRFAPTPSGALHFGSLVAAVGSFLAARHANGRWLLRIENLDRPREVAGASEHIMRSLIDHGLEWDGPVCYQNDRCEAYRQALNELRERNLVYRCSCSRREILARSVHHSFAMVYPGYCRENGPVHPERPCAWRLRVSEGEVTFSDRRWGKYAQQMERDVGDFVLRRADGIFSYQLAVVVDDAWQGITEVVRGEDLLDNTPRQILLQRMLGYAIPAYLHLPLALDKGGLKLGKQTGANPLDPAKAAENLFNAMKILHLQPPQDLKYESVEKLVDWGTRHWKTPGK